MHRELGYGLLDTPKTLIFYCNCMSSVLENRENRDYCHDFIRVKIRRKAIVAIQ
jgi:hypothetical protein